MAFRVMCISTFWFPFLSQKDSWPSMTSKGTQDDPFIPRLGVPTG